MTSDENRALLEALRDVHPLLILERTLYSDVNNRLTSPLSMDAFRALLKTMREKGRILHIATEDGNKYLITDAGFARLQEMH
jgi:hypothetical protein